MSTLPDTAPARKSPDTSPHVFVPSLGWVTRSNWQPTRPGPQPHNAGISPGYRRDARHLTTAGRVSELEAALAETQARLDALEATRAGG